MYIDIYIYTYIYYAYTCANTYVVSHLGLGFPDRRAAVWRPINGVMSEFHETLFNKCLVGGMPTPLKNISQYSIYSVYLYIYTGWWFQPL